MLRIDERLPDAPLECEVVLHVRRHARTAVRRKTSDAPKALALLYGFDFAETDEWMRAARSQDPMQAGAALAHRLLGSSEPVVALGHNAAHVESCKTWLATRKQRDGVFSQIAASDLATLLELSKARDLALAKGVDANGRERYLPILIQGPTGSGKELLARAVHDLWSRTTDRKKVPFEVVHVAG